MYLILTITCLLSIVHVNGLRKAFSSDDVPFNPCQAKSGVFFHPDSTDNHKYYQCDESGNAYSRSCGKLVWDDLRTACNWPSAAAPPPSKVGPPETPLRSPSPTPSWPTTTFSWPTTTFSWPTTTSSWPTTTTTTTSSWLTTTITTTTTTTTQSSGISVASPSSLCAPINPCGEHGECLESPNTDPSSTRRFACICSENWFGRLCEKHTDELTTPPAMILDQNNNTSETTDTFSVPVKTKEDSKYVFYGLKGSNTIEEFNRAKKKTINPDVTKETDVSTSNKKIL